MTFRRFKQCVTTLSASAVLFTASGGTMLALAGPAMARPAEPRVVHLGHYRTSAKARAAARHARLRGGDIATATIAGRAMIIDSRGRIRHAPKAIKLHPVGTGELPRPPQPPVIKK